MPSKDDFDNIFGKTMNKGASSSSSNKPKSASKTSRKPAQKTRKQPEKKRAVEQASEPENLPVPPQDAQSDIMLIESDADLQNAFLGKDAELNNFKKNRDKIIKAGEESTNKYSFTLLIDQKLYDLIYLVLPLHQNSYSKCIIDILQTYFRDNLDMDLTKLEFLTNHIQPADRPARKSPYREPNIK